MLDPGGRFQCRSKVNRHINQRCYEKQSKSDKLERCVEKSSLQEAQ